MLNECQPELLRATKTRWTFSVNNFDLEQFQFLSDYVNTGISIKLTDRWLAAAAAHEKHPIGLGPRREYNVQLRLRFQMDKNAVTSFARLRDFLLSSDPDDHQAMRSSRWLQHVPVEVGTLYHPRTGSSAKLIQSMTKGEAKLIEFRIIKLLRNVSKQHEWATTDGIRHPDRWSDVCKATQAWFEEFMTAIRETWAVQRTS
jgi:hypothetical protein